MKKLVRSLILFWGMIFSCSAIAKEIQLDFTLAEDSSIVSSAWIETYEALRANDCNDVMRIFNENTIGGKLMDPDLVLLSSYLYEKGFCLPKDHKRAFEVIDNEVDHWTHMGVRYGYLNEFGIGTPIDEEKALEYYFLSLFTNLSTSKEFNRFFFETYFNIYLSGKKLTPVIEAALDKHHKLVNGSVNAMRKLEQKLRQVPKTERAADYLLDHIETIETIETKK